MVAGLAGDADEPDGADSADGEAKQIKEQIPDAIHQRDFITLNRGRIT